MDQLNPAPPACMNADRDDAPALDTLRALHFLLSICADRAATGRLDRGTDTTVVVTLGAGKVKATMSVPPPAVLAAAWENSRLPVMQMLANTAVPLFLDCLTDETEKTAVLEWLHAAPDSSARTQVLISTMQDTLEGWSLS